jgi:DUF438 domain-containing protein
MTTIALDTGKLTVAQVNLVLHYLPCDLTFIDEQACVRLFSSVGGLASHTSADIGRRAEDCRPAAGAAGLRAVLDALRAGRTDPTELWFSHAGRFVNGRYIAVREDGTYRGALEILEDVTQVRALKGSMKLSASPREGAPPAPPTSPPTPFAFATGDPTAEQVRLIFAHLPFDVSFCDEDDAMCFFSADRESYSTCGPNDIGGTVQACHPPAAQKALASLLGEFRSGAREVASSWHAEDHGGFELVRYWAVCAADGAYRGTLEVIEDVSAVRGRAGERREVVV